MPASEARVSPFDAGYLHGDGVFDTLRTYVIGHDPERSPSAMSARQRALYEAELDVVNRHFDGLFRFGRRGFLGKLQRVRTYLWWREEMRDCSSKLYALIRQETLEVARRLVSAGTLGQVEDVWFLRWPEVLDLLDATLEPSEARQWIEERREELAGWRDFTNPNELGRRFAVGASRTATTDEGGLQGIPCSAGQVTARVRVVPTIQDAVHLQAGEILVTRFTDPGWTTLFSQIAGVVTETGGVLSHAAVIAREYGIPAVLAVPKATRELRDGQWVRLDGNAGTVTPIAEP